MKRWLPWFALSLVSAIFIVVNHASTPSLLEDSDTKEILRGIDERNDPWSWWSSDWPLGNHFYRPVSTLTFEIDRQIYHDHAAGYGRTNAILAGICVLLTFWLALEFGMSAPLASFASLLFSVWHGSERQYGWLAILGWVLAFIALCALFRPKRQKVSVILLTALGLTFLAFVLQPPSDFGWRIVDWIPGRTASTMTVFCLIAMASYLRFERLTSQIVRVPEATAYDLPATKGTTVHKKTGREFLWLVVSGLGLILALASYEQAIMVPAILLGCAILIRLQNRKPNWWIHLAFWAILFGYFVVRSRVVPSEVSGYQSQQFRTGPGVMMDILHLILPLGSWLQDLLVKMSSGLLILLTLSPWVLLVKICGNFSAYYLSIKSSEKWKLIALLLMSFFAFLPMAWLKYFGHYWYWPSSIFAIFAVLLASMLMKELVNVWSPRALQAPERQNPAPGSLPRQ